MILHKANSLQVTEIKTCLHVSHSKALPSILEIAQNFGHDTLMHLQFLGHCALRELHPALQESRSTWRESHGMGSISREGGNLLLSITVDLPFESKNNLYYTTDVLLHNDVNATCAVIGCAHNLLEYRAIQRTWMMSQETCFFLFCSTYGTHFWNVCEII